MTTKTLYDRTNEIEQALRQIAPDARITGGTVTPQAVYYNVRAQHRVDRQQLEAVCAAFSGRLHADNGQIRIEIPRDDVPVLDLSNLFRRLVSGDHEIPLLTAILGIDIEGVPLLLRLASPHVRHLLICGSPGSGKTTLALTVVASLAMTNNPQQIQLFPLGGALAALAAALALPDRARHTAPQAHSRAAVDLLGEIRIQMEERQRTGCRQPGLVIVVDELNDLLGALEQRNKTQILDQLLADGPAAGIHLVACSTPDEAIRPWAARFPIHCLGATTPPHGELLPPTPPLPMPTTCLRGAGDFLLIANGRVYRMQAAAYQDAGREALPGAMFSMERPHLALAGREG